MRVLERTEDVDASRSTMIDASESDRLSWRKSRACMGGQCVEVAALDDGGVAIRNSADPAAGLLVFTGGEFADFLGGVKSGDFDDLTG